MKQRKYSINICDKEFNKEKDKGFGWLVHVDTNVTRIMKDIGLESGMEARV